VAIPRWVCARPPQNNEIEVLVDADAKADFEKRYWKGVLDASGKANGGYY